MKALGTIAFGILALVAANFATAAPAKADSFGFHIGNGGFGIHVSDYGYRHHRYARRCWDPYYGRYVRCRYYNNYNDGYYDNYYPRYRWGHRGHRGHYYNNHWRGRHDGWRGHRGRHDGWRGHRGRHDGWRGHRGGRHDGRRGRHRDRW
jgi:hypothetical protein